MKHLKHTPGPWEAIDAKDGDGDATISIRGNAEFIASLDLVSINGGPYRIPDSGHANARLIAAAPDLLWIAERLLQCRRNSGNGDKGSVIKWTRAESERSFLDLEAHARAAIAKAEGADR